MCFSIDSFMHVMPALANFQLNFQLAWLAFVVGIVVVFLWPRKGWPGSPLVVCTPTPSSSYSSSSSSVSFNPPSFLWVLSLLSLSSMSLVCVCVRVRARLLLFLGISRIAQFFQVCGQSPSPGVLFFIWLYDGRTPKTLSQSFLF